MEALLIVHVLDEPVDVGLGLAECPIILKVYLLSLQSLEEAFGFGGVF